MNDKPHAILHSTLERWANTLDIIPFSWNGLPLNVPVYAVYATLPNPVIDHFAHHGDSLVPILRLGKYKVPLLDPTKEGITTAPNYAVVITHQEKSRFGLYAYPADHIEETFSVAYQDWIGNLQLS